jgi:hypothetical protein
MNEITIVNNQTTRKQNIGQVSIHMFSNNFQGLNSFFVRFSLLQFFYAEQSFKLFS